MKRYRVTGERPVHGHEPGTTFAADLPPEQEARLIARGSLKRVGKASSKDRSSASSSDDKSKASASSLFGRSGAKSADETKE